VSPTFSGPGTMYDPNPDSRPPLLRSLDLDGVAEYIQTSKAQRIICMVGSGLATTAGVPDYRIPGNHVHDALKAFNLSDMEDVLDLDQFQKDPEPFYEYCRLAWPVEGKYKPTLAHYFVTMLHEKGRLLRCYTQNTDTLEELAGLPAEKVVAAAGNFSSASTLTGKKVPAAELKAALDQGTEGWQQLRDKYGSLVKPDLVFFGELLPERFRRLSAADFKLCDLLIVMGSSLSTGPFNALVAKTLRTVPRVLINKSKVGLFPRSSGESTSPGHLRGGFTFSPDEKAFRDVFYEGTCDDGVRLLAQSCGWTCHLGRVVEARLPQLQGSERQGCAGLFQLVSDEEALENPLSVKLVTSKEVYEAVLATDAFERYRPAHQAARERAQYMLARDTLGDLLQTGAYPGGWDAYVGAVRNALERDERLAVDLEGCNQPIAEVVRIRAAAGLTALEGLREFFAARGRMLPGEEVPTPRSMPDLQPIYWEEEV